MIIRAFQWSVRRELMEHRAVFFAPVAAAGVALLGYLIRLFVTPPPAAANAKPDEATMAAWVASPGTPFDIAAGLAIMVGGAVGIFYCAAALSGERGDRSIYFWKSLPVSDATTVLAKFAVPMAAIPAVIMAAALLAQLVMVVLGTAVALALGDDPAGAWSASGLPVNALVLAYGVVTGALWWAPVWAWLLLVSAWARRMPLVWALGLPAAPAALEWMGTLGKGRLFPLLGDRLFGGTAATFDVPKVQTMRLTLAQIDAARFFGHPGLWAGLILAAAFLAGAIWLRRRREPN